MRDYEPNIDTPLLDEDGVSDPVILFFDDGRMCIAQYDKYNGPCWFTRVDGVMETFGSKGIKKWSPIELPSGYAYDSEYYSPNRILRAREKE